MEVIRQQEVIPVEDILVNIEGFGEVNLDTLRVNFERFNVMGLLEKRMTLHRRDSLAPARVIDRKEIEDIAKTQASVVLVPAEP